jgi:5,6,7,8-tetrahydromethanopterin hydro-lyase
MPRGGLRRDPTNDEEKLMDAHEPIRIGEAYVGEVPADAAHINVVLGSRQVLGSAWTTVLGGPGRGTIPFVAVLKPNVPVRPLTLFVNKAAIESDRHANITWGAAQAGVALGMSDAVAEGLIPTSRADELLAIAAVWVSPAAGDEEQVFRNNRRATREAVANALAGRPSAEETLAARDDCHNPFFDPRLLR